MMTSNRPLEDWGKLIGDMPSAPAATSSWFNRTATAQGRFTGMDMYASNAGAAPVTITIATKAGQTDPPADSLRGKSRERRLAEAGAQRQELQEVNK